MYKENLPSLVALRYTIIGHSYVCTLSEDYCELGRLCR